MSTHDDSRIQQLQIYCEERIPLLYEGKLRNQATIRLRREFSLIEHQGHGPAFGFLAEIERFTNHQGIFCRLAGAGPCSIVCFLLGLTEVDPIKHNLPIERFVTEPKVGFFLILGHQHMKQAQEFLNEKRDFVGTLRIHSANILEMRPEAVADLIRVKVDPGFHLRQIPTKDDRTVKLLRAGAFEELLPYKSEELLQTLNGLKPDNLESLTDILTAYQIGAYREDFFEEYVKSPLDRTQSVEGRSQAGQSQGMLLYQEQIMNLLHRKAKVPMSATYRFVKQAAKGREIAMVLGQILASNEGTKSREAEILGLFNKLQEAASYVVCKAHQLATTLPLWQAAFLKANFPQEFRHAFDQMT